MNLIIHSTPNDERRSLGGALALRLAKHLGGSTRVVRIYKSPQRYFAYEFNDRWMKLVAAAERLIIPVPVWNFSIPAALKDFFDKISQSGKLWRPGPDGKSIGLLKNRPVYVILTSGLPFPAGSPEDFVVPYIRLFFSFLGVRDVRDFRVENVSKSRQLIADKDYMDRKVREMLKVFGIK